MRSIPIAAVVLAGSLTAGLTGGVPAARAQTPSADQIINSLMPTGKLTSSTRGIRPVAPGGPAPAAAAPSAAPAVQAMAQPAAPVEAPSASLTVQFATGSAELAPGARHTLDELGRALSSQQLASYRFRIEGHTDTVGSAEVNKSLSEQRAAAVASYLSTHFKVDSARLEPVGMGEDGLLVATPPQTPEPRNRRVVVVNLGA
jgi:outer membrane protein OmpA-like peptidoglycan-associated protein